MRRGDHRKTGGRQGPRDPRRRGDAPVQSRAAGDPIIARLVEEADALLLLGVILSDTNFALSQRRLDPRRTMLAFDREVRVGQHVYPDVPIDDLIEALATRARPLGAGNAHADLRAIEYPRGLKADDGPIAPSDIAAAINDLFDRHGPMPMTADMGDCLFTAMEIENTALAAPGYYAGMGFGVPAGIGVAAATGRRPLILVGDAAFQMTGWELGNCRRMASIRSLCCSTTRVGKCCACSSRNPVSTI